MQAKVFDPFVAHHPAVLVHEVDGPDFETAWARFGAAEGGAVCPVCGEGQPWERGTSPHNQRPWIKFSCGDVIAQEITAG
jgi:hypothetical protein